jgi:hypothetical protein
MRYRRLDPVTGDMTFGHGQDNFWVNAPEGVGQWVMTRLRLNQGEWFADTTEGTPWMTQVLGERTRATRDVVVFDRVQSTPNVTDVLGYSSQVDPNARAWAASMTIDTVYGAVAVQAAKLPAAVPSIGIGLGGNRASMLGVLGGTLMEMQPADLTRRPANITDFRITVLDAGTF